MRLIGRTTELAQLRAHLASHHHTLVVGPVGIGKSALLRAAVENLGTVFVVPRILPLKPALLSVAHQLHTQGRLDLPDTDSQYLDWSEVQSQLTGPSAVELLERLIPLLAGQLLLVDDFDGITPTLARLLDPLFEATLIVGALTTVEMSPGLQRFFWHFRFLLLDPLSREEAREVLWTQTDRAALPDPHIFEQHALDEAGGNPLAIQELARQALRGPLRNPADIRQLHHEAGIHYIDLTPMLLIVGACAVVARFLALGLNDIGAYILAGSVGAFFLVGRYFIYRAMRKES